MCIPYNEVIGISRNWLTFFLCHICGLCTKMISSDSSDKDATASTTVFSIKPVKSWADAEDEERAAAETVASIATAVARAASSPPSAAPEVDFPILRCQNQNYDFFMSIL